VRARFNLVAFQHSHNGLYKIKKLLVEGEEVIQSDSASISGGGGKLVLTNKRLLLWC
jgi:hypothetical protein